MTKKESFATPSMVKWASQFTCPKCGPCTYEMVTTKKTCLDCDSSLIRYPETEFDMPTKGYKCETPITKTGHIKLEKIGDRLYLLNTIAGQKCPTLKEIQKVEKQFPVWWDQLKGLFVKKEKRPQFFQRYYAIKPDVLTNLLTQYRQMFPQIVELWVKPLENSVNMVIPPNSHEVVLYFQSEADRDAVKNDQAGKDWYAKNASTIPNAQMVLRKPKDPAFRHRSSPFTGSRTIFSSGTWPPKG